jgi:hypothetical protein
MVLIPFVDGVVLPIIGGYAIALERPYISLSRYVV